jgi:hypothetical protein
MSAQAQERNGAAHLHVCTLLDFSETQRRALERLPVSEKQIKAVRAGLVYERALGQLEESYR